MLWSPSEVLAYIKEDKVSDNVEKRQADRLVATAPLGGFPVWPSFKEDFIFIAENSEIHGPNPLFTIPTLNHDIDLNKLSTLILSADYQGLSNNKVLPGKNAQLLFPDIAFDLHAAIVYFFLFDSEARGFVRPICIGYFTSDKNKLVALAESIFKRLTEVSSILQHTNILCSISDLKALKENVSSNEVAYSNLGEAVNDLILKDIQEVLDIVEGYEGNSLYDAKLSIMMDILKKNAISKSVQKWIETPLDRSSPYSHSKKLICRPNTKICMKDLYHICDKGIILGIYHLFIVYKYFRRKYENIALSESHDCIRGNCLYFGACIKSSNRKEDDLPQNICILKPHSVPTVFSLKDENYFINIDESFETVFLNFLNWGMESKKQNPNGSTELSSCDFTSSESSGGCSSASSGYLSNDCDVEKSCDENCCGHIVSLDRIWDTIEYLKIQNPDMERTFLQILKLFDDSQRLLCSILTRSPIIILSAAEQQNDAINFIKALSVFIPRSKREFLFVDANREEPLSVEDFKTFVAVNICLGKRYTVEELIPLELVPGMCILNLKDCSFTAPTYTGRLLSNLDQRIRILPSDGPVFSVLVGFLSEIELTINWWHMVTSSSVEDSEVSSYVLSKGYTRSDMQIIEKIFELWKN